MRHNPNRPRELIRMKLRLLFTVWLVYASFVLAQDAPKVHLSVLQRFRKSRQLLRRWPIRHQP
jgi:hypothetical protein